MALKKKKQRLMTKHPTSALKTAESKSDISPDDYPEGKSIEAILAERELPKYLASE